MSDTPSHCNQCEDIFFANPTLRAEIRHLAAKYGEGVAMAELNERLGEGHAKHPRHRPVQRKEKGG
jgi:hypothetical protein